MTFTYYADVGRPSLEQNGTSHYFGYLPFAGCFRGRGLDIGLYEQTVDDKKGWIILERKKPDDSYYSGSFCEFDPDPTFPTRLLTSTGMGSPMRAFTKPPASGLCE
jgi:hypothetical protein